MKQNLEKSTEGFNKAKALCANLNKQSKEAIEAKAVLSQELHSKSEQWEQEKKGLELQLAMSTQQQTHLEQELAASRTSLQHAESRVHTLEQRLGDSEASEQKLAELTAALGELTELRRSVESKDAALEKYAGEQFTLETELEELRERVRAFDGLAISTPAPVEVI